MIIVIYDYRKLMKKKISRLDFIRQVFLGFSASILAACKRKIEPESTPISTPRPTLKPTNTPAPTYTLKPIPTPSQTPSCFRLLNPEDGSALPEIGKYRFEWDAYPPAASYRFELTLPNGVVMVLGKTENTYRDQYLEVLGAGEYSWQIFALNEKGNVLCSSESLSFNKKYIHQTPGNNNDSNSPAIPPPPGPGDQVGLC